MPRSKGYVYLIANPAFPGWIKVGKSTNPASRLRQYQTGDPMRAFRILHLEPTPDCDQAEWLVHERLTKLGFERSGEWFQVGVAIAKRAAQRAARETAE